LIKYVQLFGERRSGTNYLGSLVKKNFKHIKLTSDYGGKHWYVKDQHPRGISNQTTDFQCVRSLTDSSDTLFLVLYRNPFNWTQSMQRLPFHGDGHWSLGFSEFIRKPWKSYATEKIHHLWKHDSSGVYFIEDAKNILDLRTRKILHFNALADAVDNICYLNYESLRDNPDILREVAEQYTIPLQHSVIINNPYRSGGKARERKGFVPIEYPEISGANLEFMRNNLDWDLEESIGYNSDCYEPASEASLQDADRMWRKIKTRWKRKKSTMNDTEHTQIEFPGSGSELELTIHIRGMDPLQFVCTEDQPILQTLFRAMLNNRAGNSEGGGDLIFLQIEDETPKAIYFPSSQLVSIESNPPLSADFLQNFAAD